MGDLMICPSTLRDCFIHFVCGSRGAHTHKTTTDDGICSVDLVFFELPLAPELGETWLEQRDSVANKI